MQKHSLTKVYDEFSSQWMQLSRYFHGSCFWYLKPNLHKSKCSAYGKKVNLASESYPQAEMKSWWKSDGCGIEYSSVFNSYIAIETLLHSISFTDHDYQLCHAVLWKQQNASGSCNKKVWFH